MMVGRWTSRVVESGVHCRSGTGDEDGNDGGERGADYSLDERNLLSNAPVLRASSNVRTWEHG
jgi:hypothetical protein